MRVGNVFTGVCPSMGVGVVKSQVHSEEVTQSQVLSLVSGLSRGYPIPMGDPQSKIRGYLVLDWGTPFPSWDWSTPPPN